MSIAISRTRVRLGIILSIAVALAATADLSAQTCDCRDDQEFAECAIRTLVPGHFDPITQEEDGYFPDSFPGPGAIVKREGLDDLLYIADIYGGSTYVWSYEIKTIDPFEVEVLERKDLVIPSPGGSRATTGLTFVNGFLVWAIDDEIWRTDIEGGDVIKLGDFDLEAIANLVREDSGDPNIVTGRIGGIAYHQTRATLWAVDIVNDFYFEVETNGSIVVEDGRPNYFFNPLRNSTLGGAYGNDLTYVANDAGEFFDIPVGKLSEGRPSRVMRVHAAPNGDAAIGDETGVLYSLDENLESPDFVTGIVYWGDSCEAGQNSEILLEVSATGADPRIIEVTADDPTTSTVADFACSAVDAATARISWRKTSDYGTLTIRRRRLGTTTSEDVFSTAFADDPEEFTDTGLLEGTYEYELAVSDGGFSPPYVCRMNIGRGGLLDVAGYSELGDGRPFGATITRDGKLLAVDMSTGDAGVFNLDHERESTIPGPESDATFTGIAVRPDAGEIDRLFWLQSTGTSHSFLVTTMDGVVSEGPILLDVPVSSLRGQVLGDISYDQVNDVFWSVDILNGVIVPFSPSGRIPEEFAEEQLELDDAAAVLTGGIALVTSTLSSVTFDLPVNDGTTGRLDAYVRVTFDLGTLEQTSELFRFDLRDTIDASGASSLALSGDIAILTSVDNDALFKVNLASEAAPFYTRGDINNDTAINISDPSALIGHLFLGAPSVLACEAAADTNRDGELNLADAVYLFSYLFDGGPAPAAPFPDCGVDAETSLSCQASICLAP